MMRLGRETFGETIRQLRFEKAFHFLHHAFRDPFRRQQRIAFKGSGQMDGRAVLPRLVRLSRGDEREVWAARQRGPTGVLRRAFDEGDFLGCELVEFMAKWDQNDERPPSPVSSPPRRGFPVVGRFEI